MSALVVFFGVGNGEVMHLDIRKIESSSAAEFYITAIPEHGKDTQSEARTMFTAVADAVKTNKLRIIRERVFVPDGCLRPFHTARHAAYPQNDPPIATDWLMAGSSGPVGGIQIHAVRGPTEWSPLRSDAGVLGWTFKQNGTSWAVTGGLCVPDAGDGPKQARAAFEAGEALLAQAGMNLGLVARTWVFMDGILDWYGPFNETRNRLFVKRGLMPRAGDGARVPASTGMGVTPVCPAKCAVEMLAVKGPENAIKRYTAHGKAKAGSDAPTIARAVEAVTPAGRSVFVSGMAAVDDAGTTCHKGDAKSQIRMTLDGLVSVLSEANANPKDVCQAIAYCKNFDVVEIFNNRWRNEIAWPWIIVVGDSSRNDILFEAEATACVASNS